jgi:putative oxidoreductase
MIAAGPLVLRVILAVLLVAHAAHWLFGTFNGSALGPGGIAATTAHFAATGMSPALPIVVSMGIVQLVGGALLFVGFLTRTASIALVVVELVRIGYDSARWGFFLNWAVDPTRGHGIEYSLLVLAVLLCLAITGAGDWSVDGLRARTHQVRAAGRARIRDHA